MNQMENHNKQIRHSNAKCSKDFKYAVEYDDMYNITMLRLNSYDILEFH